MENPTDVQALCDRLQSAEAQIAALKATPVTKGDRATGRLGGLFFSLFVGAIALTLCWERRDSGFYPRQEISPYVLPLVALVGVGLGVPISSGAIGNVIDKVVPKS